MKNHKTILITILLITGVLFTACAGGETFGEKVTGNATLTIADALAQGDNVSDDDVVVSGEVSAVCPSGCWIDVSDDNGNMLHAVVGGDFALPQTLQGKDVKIAGYLQYNKGKGMVELVATGVTTA